MCVSIARADTSIFISIYNIISASLALSSDNAALHGKSRHVHEAAEVGHHGGAADEGTGQGGEGQEAGELSLCILSTVLPPSLTPLPLSHSPPSLTPFPPSSLATSLSLSPHLLIGGAGQTGA